MLRRTLIALLTCASLAWTAAGETSDPVLAPRELPAEITGECAAACAETPGLVTRWLGRARGADLFVVARERCDAAACAAWLVARRAHATTTLLALSSEFRLEPVTGRLPAVRTRTELGPAYTSYNRYEWDGARYVRTQTRLVHRVDGVECGNDAECDAAAREAARRGESNRAVRIWQQVHGVAWI